MSASSVLVLLVLLIPALSTARSDEGIRTEASFITTPGILDFGTIGTGETASLPLYFHYPQGVEGSPWRLETSSSWVVLDRTGGQFVTSTPHRVTVTVNSGNLDPGTHRAHVVITGEGAESRAVPVLLHVEYKPRTTGTGVVRYLTIEPPRPEPLAPGLSRVFRASGQVGDDRTGDDRTVDVTGQARWISDNTSVAEFLEPGVLQARAKGVARLTAEKDGVRSESIPVRVDEPAGPIIALSGPDAALGRVEANASRELQYVITNTGAGALAWRASVTVPWIRAVTGDDRIPLSAAGSAIPSGEGRSLTVRVNARGLEAGEYEGALVIRSNGGDRVIEVTMTVVTLVEVVLTPLKITLPEDQSRRLMATAVWSDGARSDVSSSRWGYWINSNPSAGSFQGRSSLFMAQSPGWTEIKRIESGKESASAAIEVTPVDPRARLRVAPHLVDLGTIGPGETTTGRFDLRRSGSDAVAWKLDLADEWEAGYGQEPLNGVMTEATGTLKITLRLLDETPVETPDGSELFDLELVIEAGAGQSALYHRGLPAGSCRDRVVFHFDDQHRTLFLAYKVSTETSRPVLRLEPRVLNLGVLEPERTYMPRVSVRNEGKSMLSWSADVQGRRVYFHDMRLPGGVFMSLYNEKAGDDQFYNPPEQAGNPVRITGWWRGRGGYPERFSRRDSLTYSFEGTGVAVGVFTSPDAGSFQVNLNGAYLAEIDCTGPADERREVMLAGNLGTGPQVLTLTAAREGPFRIEGFRVYGTAVKKAAGNWIRVSPARGTTRTSPDYVSLIINPAGLDAGLYRENILFDSDGGRGVVELFFEVKEARTTALMPVYLYRQGEDHLYLSEALTLSDEVLRGYHREDRAFTLFSPGTPGTTELYAWHDPRRNTWFYTTDKERDSREATGHIFHGSIGNIALVPIRETRELYRFYNPETRRYLYTTTLSEESGQRRKGYRYDGIAGYVR
jgi:hypothetical protein